MHRNLRFRYESFGSTKLGRGFNLRGSHSTGRKCSQCLRQPSGRRVADSILDTSVALIGTLIAFLEFGRYRRTANADVLLIVIAVILLAWVHSLFDLVPTLLVPHVMSAGLGARIRDVGNWCHQSPRGLVSPMGQYLWRAIGAPSATTESSQKRIRRSFGDRSGSDRCVRSCSYPSHTTGCSTASCGLGPSPLSFSYSERRYSSSRRGDFQFSLKCALTEFQGWLATGCIFAGFSMISSALLPAHGVYWVRPSDLCVKRRSRLGRGEPLLRFVCIGRPSPSRHAARPCEQRPSTCTTVWPRNLALSAPVSCTHRPRRERSRRWHEQLQAIGERALAEARRDHHGFGRRSDRCLLTRISKRTADSVSR